MPPTSLNSLTSQLPWPGYWCKHCNVLGGYYQQHHNFTTGTPQVAHERHYDCANNAISVRTIMTIVQKL